MDDGSQDAAIAVSIDDDATVARVTIRGDAEPATITADQPTAAAREAGVEVDESVTAHIEEAVRRFREEPRGEPCDFEHVIAEQTPPVAGTDGRIEWVGGFDPRATAASSREAEQRGGVDHYNRVRYLRVGRDAHVATIHPPTPGRPGRDVCGRPIAPTPGRPCPIGVDSNLIIDKQGHVVARRDGMLELVGEMLKVSRLLEVDEWVDFSTGNITFDGSVEVGKGVRDRFEVHTTESIVVHGLVGASKIRCGGNFVCDCGMAGKQRGHLQVGGRAEVGYLNYVRGVIEGDLLVRHELVNCRLTVGGHLIGEEAIVVGGDSVIGGGARIGQLGNDGLRATTLVVGTVARGHRLDRLHRRLASELADCRRRHEQLQSAAGLRRPRRAQALAALEAKIEALDRRIGWSDQERAELAAATETERGQDIQMEVLGGLHAGVRLLIGHIEAVPRRFIKGPILVRMRGERDPTLRIAGSERSLAAAMQVRSRAA